MLGVSKTDDLPKALSDYWLAQQSQGQPIQWII